MAVYGVDVVHGVPVEVAEKARERAPTGQGRPQEGIEVPLAHSDEQTRAVAPEELVPVRSERSIRPPSGRSRLPPGDSVTGCPSTESIGSRLRATEARLVSTSTATAVAIDT